MCVVESRTVWVFACHRVHCLNSKTYLRVQESTKLMEPVLKNEAPKKIKEASLFRQTLHCFWIQAWKVFILRIQTHMRRWNCQEFRLSQLFCSSLRATQDFKSRWVVFNKQELDFYCEKFHPSSPLEELNIAWKHKGKCAQKSEKKAISRCTSIRVFVFGTHYFECLKAGVRTSETF